MQTPDFKKTTNFDALTHSSTKSRPPLAAVSIHRSRLLVRIYQLIYGLFGVCLLIAILPWLAEYLWSFIALPPLWFALLHVYRRQVSEIYAGQLWFEGDNWCAHPENCEVIDRYSIADEVVCWSFIIILPMRDQKTSTLRYLILASDALSPADNARLRTWLRVCLKPKR